MDTFFFHQILTSENIRTLYQKHILLCYEKSNAFIQTQFPDLSPKKKRVYIKKLKNFFVFSAVYNLSETEIENSLQNIKTLQELDSFIFSQYMKINEQKKFEEKILLKGEIQRLIFGFQRPSFFQKSQRVYIKINPISPLYLFIQESVAFLNTYLPAFKKLTLIHKTKNKASQYFILTDEKEEIKTGKFLQDLYFKINLIHLLVQALSKEDFEEFIFLFKNNQTPSPQLKRKLNDFLKKKTLSSIRFSSPLFSLLQGFSDYSKEDFEKAIGVLKEHVFEMKTTIHEMQIKSQKKQAENQKQPAGDLILLTSHPKDIARISQFTDWETCMSYGEERADDLPFQIGYGSVAAYLLNSKNPHKKLARILLKPFAKHSLSQQLSDRLNLFYTPENKAVLKQIETQIDMGFELKKRKKIFLKSVQKMNNKIPSAYAGLLPEIYLLEKTYGSQNPLFSKYILQITSKFLNHQNTFGAFYAMWNYYRDTLNYCYFFSDPKNPSHLPQFLSMRNCPYTLSQTEGKTYLYTKIIYAKDTKNLNLSGVRAKAVTLFASDLSLIDERGFKTNELSLIECDNSLHLSSLIETEDKLTLNGKNLTVLPKNIKTKELVLETPNLSVIPNELFVQHLSIINSRIEKLPSLTLNTLNAKGTKISDLRNVNVTDYLDLSNTPVQFLQDNMTLTALILKNCSNLKKLPSRLSVKGLDISGTSISTIPSLHYEWLLMNRTTALSQLPNGTTFEALEAQNARLKELPADITAKRINISNSIVTKLPENLSCEELIISETDIQSLPQSLKTDTLKAKKTKITELPPNLNIRTADLRETPLQTIHYSQKITYMRLSKLPAFIHPAFSPFIFAGFDEKEVQKSQNRYIATYLTKTKIAHNTPIVVLKRQNYSFSNARF